MRGTPCAHSALSQVLREEWQGPHGPLSATSERKIQPDLAPETPIFKESSPDPRRKPQPEERTRRLAWSGHPWRKSPRRAPHCLDPWLVRFGPSLDSAVSCRYEGNFVPTVVSHKSFGRSDGTSRPFYPVLSVRGRPDLAHCLCPVPGLESSPEEGGELPTCGVICMPTTEDRRDEITVSNR